MKKLLSLLLCLLLLTATLTACGDDNQKDTNDDAVISTTADPHAGHNHASSNPTIATTATGSHDTSQTTNDLLYRYYTNADKTYRVQIISKDNKVLFERDGLINVPFKEEVSASVISLSWATGQGPNDYEAIYWNKETATLSEAFWAPRGCDGVRIAYPSADQTKILVQDLFSKDAYYKEYALTNAVKKNGDVIVGGRLHENKKTVIISYNSSETDASAHMTLNLYD